MAKDGNNEQTYITYFQKVMTIGIMSGGKDAKDAQVKASKKLKNSEIACGVIAETKFEPTATEVWTRTLPKA